MQSLPLSLSLSLSLSLCLSLCLFVLLLIGLPAISIQNVACMFRTTTLGTAEFVCRDAQARQKTDLLLVQRVSKLVCERHRVPIVQDLPQQPNPNAVA